jgi:hypothetical protein
MTERELNEKVIDIVSCSVFDPNKMSQKLRELYQEVAAELSMRALKEFSEHLENDGNKVIDEAIRTLKHGYKEENKTNGFIDRLRNSIIMYVLSDKTFIEPLKATILIKLHGELEKLIKEKL